MKDSNTEQCSCCNPCSKDEVKPDPKSPDRRKFLGASVGIINVGLLAAIAGPVLGFIASPLGRKRSSKWVPVAALEDIPEGAAHEISYKLAIKDGYQDITQKYTVFLTRQGDDVICIDPACTHLGCRVKYQDDQKRFFCPCHGGVFDAEGKVVSGPPPHALDRHKTKVEKGQVWIQREV
ncbi:MAG: Rieske (2Fe-2S) protein [Armatimonadetes bacterium]|nr:Rieske (2Fe-2S) protein [Armatimonadota bacterium]